MFSREEANAEIVKKMKLHAESTAANNYELAVYH